MPIHQSAFPVLIQFPSAQLRLGRGTYQLCPPIDLSKLAKRHDSGIVFHPCDGYYILDMCQLRQLGVRVGIPYPHTSIST